MKRKEQAPKYMTFTQGCDCDACHGAGEFEAILELVPKGAPVGCEPVEIVLEGVFCEACATATRTSNVVKAIWPFMVTRVRAMCFTGEIVWPDIDIPPDLHRAQLLMRRVQFVHKEK